MIEASTESKDPTLPQKKVSSARVLVAAMLGTTIEWYDFFIYGTAAALIFSQVFFPSSEPATGTLTAFAAFGAGFIMRPLGGVIIGHLGDKYGRRPMLQATVLLMGGATVAIGILPSYAAIGIWAPALLVLLRLLQGFAAGGEWGGATLIAIEHAPPNRRTFYGAFTQAAVPIAYLLSAAMFFVLQGALDKHALLAWGWRIPFVLSIVVVVIAVLVRSGVAESPEFRAKTKKSEKLPLLQVLTKYPRTVALTIGLTIVTSTDFYLGQVFLLSYATAHAGVAASSMLLVTIIGSAVNAGMTFVAARMADRIGNRTVFYIGIIGLAVLAFPTYLIVNTGSVGAILAVRMIGNAFNAAAYAPIASILAGAFSVKVRYTGVSLCYQAAAVLGGGFAPFIAQALLTGTGSWMAVAGYSVTLCLISFVSMTLLGKAAKESREQTVLPAVA
ncbi:MFS transporter [Amycolatopsis nalaikhensis]|uniref:MFS transporter n=1 Tax=Amycolatopsis nalaikhensis TaxID=715472 RepID=A0ABY8XAR1_9PSEU|nr:MFS transporter [Amycolatopsis sp. 2-2]WIV52990.1 MFS transporter [Amycolatopsis sp. 2-2]